MEYDLNHILHDLQNQLLHALHLRGVSQIHPAAVTITSVCFVAECAEIAGLDPLASDEQLIQNSLDFILSRLYAEILSNPQDAETEAAWAHHKAELTALCRQALADEQHREAVQHDIRQWLDNPQARLCFGYLVGLPLVTHHHQLNDLTSGAVGRTIELILRHSAGLIFEDMRESVSITELVETDLHSLSASLTEILCGEYPQPRQTHEIVILAALFIMDIFKIANYERLFGPNQNHNQAGDELGALYIILLERAALVVNDLEYVGLLHEDIVNDARRRISETYSTRREEYPIRKWVATMLNPVAIDVPETADHICRQFLHHLNWGEQQRLSETGLLQLYTTLQRFVLEKRTAYAMDTSKELVLAA